VPRLGSFEKWISRYYPVGPLSSLLLPVIAARCARTRCPFPFVGCRALDGFKVELFSSLSFPSKFPRHYFPGNSLARPIRQERPRGSSPRSIDRLSRIRFADMPRCSRLLCVYFARYPCPVINIAIVEYKSRDDEVVNARRTDNAPRMRPCIITRSKNGLLPAKRRAPASGTCSNDRPARIARRDCESTARSQIFSLRSFRARGKGKTARTTCPRLRFLQLTSYRRFLPGSLKRLKLLFSRAD